MSIFKCPVCGAALEKCGSALCCNKGHSFDMAKEGYVNLMPSNKPHSNSGDSPEMMASRTRFLNGGYYAHFKDALCKTAAGLFAGGEPLIVDAGCGEGYYTSALGVYLHSNGINAKVAGIDLSKRGIRAAAKRGTAHYAVAGIFDLPFADNSADLVINVFAPICESEFLRVLKPGGVLLVAGPGRRHLWGLKQALYDSPYENDEETFCPEGFEPLNRTEVKANITVPGDDIGALFMMTPYYWNTPEQQAKRLDGLEKLETPAEFVITTVKKKQSVMSVEG